MALTVALAELEASMDALDNHFRDYAVRNTAIGSAPLILEDECLLEGLLSHAWQAWNQFCRECVFGSCLGSLDANGVPIAAHLQALSADHVSAAAISAKKKPNAPNHWGATNSLLRYEPTWGDTDVLQNILPRLQPANVLNLVAAFSLIHGRAKTLQVIRNGAAHNNVQTMADILLLQSGYVAFRISHPVEALYWVEPSSGDFLITNVLEELKIAASLAIS